jgi:hypothetical protein
VWNTYISIADCEICRNIPQKISREREEGEYRNFPPELGSLSSIVDIEEDTNEAYCTSFTKLLKCPQCGTYYYQNIYEDEGQHFMDPTHYEKTIHRYDPLTAMHFLEGLMVKTPGSELPPTFGALKKAFAEGTTTPPTKVTNDAFARKLDVIRIELEEFRKRYPVLIREMIDVITKRSLEWQVKMYIAESLLAHFIREGDFDQIKKLILQHKDPVIRVEMAHKLLGVATLDAPVIDLVHIPVGDRNASKNILVDKTRITQIANILFEAAYHDDVKTFEYDHGYGKSKYQEQPLRAKALYGLNLAADLVDVGFILPVIFTLISPDKWTSNRVFWLLKTMAKRRKVNAQLILAELNKLDEATKQLFAKDFDYTSLLAECKKKVQKRARVQKQKSKN